ncbi:hypothetical protein OIU84_008114 [Salix udensis]|uniref:Uncharacterized protein n=1 Tax=Salix udensis TaxID=889485 RepID=A0AAD6P0D6_9ROSI|nr:hypothetical protein OIU84_008114 [Salix udensis]
MSFCIMLEVELRMTVTEVELRSSCWVNFWGQAKIVSLHASCEGKGIERALKSGRQGEVETECQGLEEWPPRRSGNRVPTGRRRRNTLKRDEVEFLISRITLWLRRQQKQWSLTRIC